MIVSRYTELITDKVGGNYMFNCLNRKWVILDKKLFDITKSNYNNIDHLKQLHPDFYKMLVEERFIVDTTEQDIKNGINYVVEQYDSYENITVTINPTMDCNLRCWYCYENREPKSVMSDDVLVRTISYITALLSTRKISTLRLSFFGGEPLLYYGKIISPIVHSVYEACKKFGTILFLTFTTNGLLVNDILLDDLEQFDGLLSRTNFQIAFDGSKEYHDSIKYLGAGHSCYDQTISNVRKVIERGGHAVVRCNYDAKTLMSFIEVIDNLKEYHSRPNLRFLFQKIWQETKNDELLALRKKFKQITESRYNINSNLHNLLGNSLHRCYADYRHNVVINYNGLLYRCTARSFSKENSFGSLGVDGIIESRHDTSNKHPIPMGEYCKECRILPICPCCSQNKLEQGQTQCPININEEGMERNIWSAFQDLSGVKVL